MKQMIGIAILILFSLSTVAYVPVEEYEGVRFKTYSNSVNKEECYDLIDRLPEEYFKGLSVIKIQWKHQLYSGYYRWGGTIEMLGNCEEDILIHELAHHRQYMKGDSLYQVMTHTGRFYQFEKEIKNKTTQYPLSY